MFVHFGVGTWIGQDYDNTNETFNLDRINPVNFDANQWCEVAKSWGAELILVVAKHVGGFCWWPTQTTEYCVRNTSWKNGEGNLIKDVADACRSHDLKMGIYVYPDDPRYMADIGRGGRTDDPSLQEDYGQLMRKQWQEVLTICGTDLIEEIWFDGGCILPLEDVIDSLAPNAVVFEGPFADIHWAGNEKGIVALPNWNVLMVTEQGRSKNPDGQKWHAVEADTPLYDHYWFWSPDKSEKRKSVDKLMSIYLSSVGHGSVLLLNSSPDTTGKIVAEDVQTYSKFGGQIAEQFDHPLAEITRVAGDSVYLDLPSNDLVNTIDVWEDYRYGHRIREYKVEVRTSDGWKMVAGGKSVGRRKIDLFSEVRAQELRFISTQSVGTPLILRLAAHHTTFKSDNPVSQFTNVTASSVYSSMYKTENINDGNMGTRWAPLDSDKHSWVQYDFERLRRIATTSINELATRVQGFVLEVRDTNSEEWNVIYRGTTIGDNFSADFPPVTTRFVRLRVTDISEASATIWEWQLDDRRQAFEHVPRAQVAAEDTIIEIDLSRQIIDPGKYEVVIKGIRISDAQPLFDGSAGEERFLEKVGDGEYIINRTQAVAMWSSTGIRLVATGSISDSLEVLIRTRQASGVSDFQESPVRNRYRPIRHNNKTVYVSLSDEITKINVYGLNGRLLQTFTPYSKSFSWSPRYGSGFFIVEIVSGKDLKVNRYFISNVR